MYCITAHIRLFRQTHIDFVYHRYHSNDHYDKSDTWMQEVDDLTHHSSILQWKECQYLHMYYGVVLSTDQMFCRWSGGSCPALGGWIAGSSLLAEQTSFLQDQSACKLHPATGCLNINQILCFLLLSTTMSLWTQGLFIFTVLTLYSFFSNEWLCVLAPFDVCLCFLDLKRDWVGSAEIRGCGLHLGRVHNLAFSCIDFTETMMDWGWISITLSLSDTHTHIIHTT